MKSCSILFFHSLLSGAVFASNEIPSNCVSTHLLPVITTSVTALALTDLMPQATGSVPAPGMEHSSGSGSGLPSQPGSHQGNQQNPDHESKDGAAQITTVAGAGQSSDSVNSSNAASTPLSSDHPQYVSGALNLGASNIGSAAFVAGSIVLAIHLANLI